MTMALLSLMAVAMASAMSIADAYSCNSDFVNSDFNNDACLAKADVHPYWYDKRDWTSTDGPCFNMDGKPVRMHVEGGGPKI